MNTIRRFFQARALMLAALVLTSFPCTAQTVGSPRPGTFALRADTHGGLAAVRAGEYSFQADSSGSFPPAMVRSVSGKGVALIDPDSQSLPDEAAPAGPVLATKNGTTSVKRLYLGEAGLVFHCSMAKKKPVSIAKAAGHRPPVGGAGPAA